MFVRSELVLKHVVLVLVHGEAGGEVIGVGMGETARLFSNILETVDESDNSRGGFTRDDGRLLDMRSIPRDSF